MSATTPPQASPAFRLEGQAREFQARATIVRLGTGPLSPARVTLTVTSPEPLTPKLTGYFGLLKDRGRPYLFWSLSSLPRLESYHRACFDHFEKPSLLHWIGPSHGDYSKPLRNGKSLLRLSLNGVLLTALYDRIGDPSTLGRWLHIRLTGRWPAAVRRVPDSCTHCFIALG